MPSVHFGSTESLYRYGAMYQARTISRAMKLMRSRPGPWHLCDLLSTRGTPANNALFRPLLGGTLGQPKMDGQKSPKPQPHGDNYRSIACKLRKLALECRSPRARQEILDLAALYERRGDHFDLRAAD